MAISSNEWRRRRAFFGLSIGSAFVTVALSLLAGSFLLITPTRPMTGALAQEGNNTTSTTPNSATTTSSLELSLQPVFQDQVRGISQTPINQTHMQLIVSGNGTLTLPNSTETINTTSTGSLIVSMKGTTATAAGKEILTTKEDGSENAIATLYEIAQFNMQDGSGKGIAIAVVHTNSTGKLAPLDGMMLVGQEEFHPDGSRLVTMWKWESGIPQVKIVDNGLKGSPMNITETSELPPTLTYYSFKEET